MLGAQASPPARVQKNQLRFNVADTHDLGSAGRRQARTPALPARSSLIIFRASAVRGFA